jgi:hypothetical protein
MGIIERDLRTLTARRRDDRDRPPAARNALTKTRSLRMALDRVQRAWDQGYACAVDMVARLHADGVTAADILENLAGRVRQPQAVPVLVARNALARGTRDMAPLTEADTAPIEVDD